MATRRKKIVIAATSMLILLSMVGYSNADATDETALAEKYCGGATAMIVTEIGIEGKEDNENFRCFAKTDIKKPDSMLEEEFCSYVMPLPFDKYKDGKCYFIPFVNCDSSTTFAYYSLCVRILESQDNFVNQEAQCKTWGGELLKVPARNLRKWVYRNHKGSFWTSLEEEENESLVLYTFDNIADPDIQPGSLIKTPKKEKKRYTVTETANGQTFTRLVLEGNLHGGICTKPGKLTIAGRKDKLELYSAIHPNSYGTPKGAKIFVSTGVYVPRIGSMTNEYTKRYGQFDYTFYQDICALVPDVGKLQSQVGIPHEDLESSLKTALQLGRWGMLGTTAIRDGKDGCDTSRKWGAAFGFQSIYGKKPYEVGGKLWGSNGDKIKECSDMPDTALVVTESGLLPRAPFVRTHVFCYVGEPLAFKGLTRGERCDKNAAYDTIADVCKCNTGYKDKGQRETGTECVLCPISPPPYIFFTFDHKYLNKEIMLDVTTSMTHLAQIQNFKLVTTDNDVQATHHGGTLNLWGFPGPISASAHKFFSNTDVHWSKVLTNKDLHNTVFPDKETIPYVIIVTDGNLELWKDTEKNGVFGMSKAGMNPQALSFLLELRERRGGLGKFMFINVVKGYNANAVAKMKKDWIAAGIVRTEDEIVAVTDTKSLGNSVIAFHIVQAYCNK